jgi:hypothetical protein
MTTGIRVVVDTKVLGRIIAETPERVGLFMDSLAEGTVNDVVGSFGSGPPGRTYRRGQRVHVASAPPGPPAVDTGALRNSIGWMAEGTSRIVHDAVEYGVYLEGGTEHMAARPFMGPAFERLRRDLGTLAKNFVLVKP